MVISSFYPESAINTGSVTITMKGSGFQSEAITTILLRESASNSISCSKMKVVSDSELSATFVLNYVTPGYFTIIIKTSTSSYCTQTPFRVLYDNPPHVTGITPSSAHLGDEPVSCRIVGSYFMSGCSVEMQSSRGEIFPASIVTYSPNELICSFSGYNDKGDRYLVRVKNCDGQTSQEPVYFVVYGPPPVVMQVNPNRGWVRDSSCVITVSGSDFTDGCQIHLHDPVRGYVTTNVGSTAVSGDGGNVTGQFNLTGLSPGTYQLIVENPDGQESGQALSFTVLAPAPTVSAVTPSKAFNSDSALFVTVSGSDFTDGCQIHLHDPVRGHVTTNVGPTAVSGDGGNVTGQFNLTGLSPGTYRLVVENPDGQISEGESVFEVVEMIKPMYTISLIAGKGGVIIPSGMIQVSEHSDLSIDIVSDPGFHVQDVYLDTVSYGSIRSLPLIDIISNHTVFADFSRNDPVPSPVPTVLPPPPLTPVPTPEPMVYYLNVSAEYGGIIRPNGTIPVQKGSDIRFEIDSLENFTSSCLLVDMDRIQVQKSWILHSVQSNHTLRLISDRNMSAAWADFRMTPLIENATYCVMFTSDEYPDALWEIWELGDGSITYGRPMNHTYLQPGLYSVLHEVIFRNSTSRCQREIIIRPSPPMRSNS